MGSRWSALPSPCSAWAQQIQDLQDTGLLPSGVTSRPLPVLVGKLGPAWAGRLPGTSPLFLAPVGEQGSGVGTGGPGRPPRWLWVGGQASSPYV